MTPAFDNQERRRYYGIRVGDIVSCDPHTNCEVIGYGFLDNNKVYLRYEDGTEGSQVAEWCKIITKVEDKI
jgi:hypothetical protein